MTQLQTAATRQREVEVWWWSLEDKLGLGNKRYKLRPYLERARTTSCKSLLSFGGAYSNHLHALAAMANTAELGSIGVVRGEPKYSDNPTLSDAVQSGMKLEFISRSEYRNRHQLSWLNEWKRRYPDSLIVPEGGSGVASATACQRILDGIDSSFLKRLDTICCALGTGATVLGLQAEYGSRCGVKGYDVVNDASVVDRLELWFGKMKLADAGAAQVTSLPVIVNASGTGYGRCTSAIYEIIEMVFNSTGLLLDPIYTGKMASYLINEIDNGVYEPGTVLLAVHTGGLQGWRGKWIEAKRYMSFDTISRVRHTLEKYQFAPTID